MKSLLCASLDSALARFAFCSSPCYPEDSHRLRHLNPPAPDQGLDPSSHPLENGTDRGWAVANIL